MPASPPHWRLILGNGEDHTTPTPHTGPTNMAIDRALLDAVAAGGTPVLRFYRWSPATLSFGRNQPARGLYDEAAAADRGIAFVRRPTGGQAVMHDDELTYAVVAPIGAVGRPREAYRRINEALVRGLQAVGVEAELVGGQGQGQRRMAKSWAEACFRRPERGEVAVRGRKLVGSAQRTESRTILQHGSILLGGSQAPAEALLLPSPSSIPNPRSSPPDPRSSLLDPPASILAPRSSILDPRSSISRSSISRSSILDPRSSILDPRSSDRVPDTWTTLDSELPRRPPLEDLVVAVVAAFEDVVGITLARSKLGPDERAGAEELRGFFGSRAWTWRR